MFAGAFLTTAVLLGGVTGFMAVDLSTDRYMPNRFPRMFLVDQVGPKGATLSWMGQNYYLNAQTVGKIQVTLWEYRGLLPGELRLAANLAAQAMDVFQQWNTARE